MVVFPLPKQEKISTAFLHEEYKRVGIPVFEVTHRQWRKKFALPYDVDDYDNAGEFLGECHNDEQNLKKHIPRRFILINSRLSNSWKLVVFYHEIGHYACVRARCACAKNGFVFRKTELHAELAAMYISLRRGYKRMTFNTMVEAVLDLDAPRQDYVYNATRMVKHPLFIEARIFVGPMFTRWLNRKANARIKEKYLNAVVDESTNACRWAPSPLLRRFVRDGRQI